MLAMVVNDNACCLMARVALASIASMLAPAGGRGRAFCRQICRNGCCLAPHIRAISNYAHPGA